MSGNLKKLELLVFQVFIISKIKRFLNFLVLANANRTNTFRTVNYIFKLKFNQFSIEKKDEYENEMWILTFGYV